MARLMMPEHGAMPAMSYYSPYAQAPYYVIPQPAHSIPHYVHGAPQYVYSPTEYGQSNGSAPVSKLVPPQGHQYPVDPTKKDLHEAMKQIPQGFVTPNARHPVYVLPDGTTVGQPVRYPVYDDASRTHLHPFGNQQPGGAQYVNNLPVAAPVCETLPAAQPGMRWKLVPVAEDATPIVSPEASPAPVMLKSPEDDRDPGSEGENAVADPYKKFLSLLFPKPEDKSQTKDGQVVEAPEVKGGTPKSVRIIPVTDAPRDDPKRAMDQAPREEKKSVALEGEGALKDCVKKQPNKASAPTLKPIRLVPSLEFVKKKPAAGASKGTRAKPVSHQTSEEAGLKMVEKRAREESVEGSSDVECHTVQKGDEPSAKKRLITDSETAARLIQSVFRGHLVRRCQPLKHLRDIARVMKEYRSLAADKSALLERCKDPAEWTKVSEAIMSLLLQLDVIQGVDPVVRDIRKYTSKEVLKLQSEVDAVKQQPEERVDDLLLKLLEKLPNSGQPADMELVSEVVKRLSLLKERERDKDTDTTSQGESTAPEMVEANCRSGMAAIDTNLSVSSPTELELQKLAETVAADFVDVVLAHSEDTVGSAQSMAGNEEGVSGGQGILDSHDRALLEVCEGVDGMGEEAPKDGNAESEMEGTGRLAPTESAGTGETQAEKFNVVDGEDKEQTSEVEAHEEMALSNEEAATSSDSVKVPNIDLVADLKDDPVSTEAAYEGCCSEESVIAPEFVIGSNSVKDLADEEKVPNIDLIADLKDDDPASRESANEECSCKEPVMAPEAAADVDSAAQPRTDEEKVPNVDMNADLKDDPASTEAGFDSPGQATSSLPNENEDSVEVMKVDNTPAEASPSHLTEGLWNGLDSSCHDVHSSSRQPFAQDSEDAATESSHPGVDEPCNITSNPCNADVVERISMKVQIPDKSFSSQEGNIAGDSPTSVLDTVISMAPTEESISEDVAEDHRPMNEEEALQCAISDLESLNNEGEFFLKDESLQLESAISDLHSLNNSGQGFLKNLSLAAVTAKVDLPKPPSLSLEALDLLEHGVEISEGLCPSSTSSPSSETTLTRHLLEENAVLKELVKDLLKWSQWQSSATLSLHKMIEKLALEVLETKAVAKKAAKRRRGKNKKAHAKKSFCKV